MASRIWRHDDEQKATGSRIIRYAELVVLALAYILLVAVFPLSELLSLSYISLNRLLMAGFFGAACAIAIVPLAWFILGQSSLWLRCIVALVCAESAQMILLVVQTWGPVWLLNEKMTGPTFGQQIPEATVETALLIMFLAAMGELVRVGTPFRFCLYHESVVKSDSAHSVGAVRILITITIIAAITPFLQRRLVTADLWMGSVLVFQIISLTVAFGIPLAIAKVLRRRPGGIVHVIEAWNVLLSISIIAIILTASTRFGSARYWSILTLSLVLFWVAYNVVGWGTLRWARRQLGWFQNTRDNSSKLAGGAV